MLEDSHILVRSRENGRDAEAETPQPETELSRTSASGHRVGGPLTTAARRQRQLAAVTHGLRVRAGAGRKLRDRRVSRLTHRVFELLPWLQPSDEPAVRGWCELAVIAEHVAADLLTSGHAGPDGKPRDLLDSFRRLKLAQLTYARELGMTPAARVELGVNMGRGLNVAEEFARLHREQEQEP